MKRNRRNRDWQDPVYQQWRRSVLERDDYRCQMPGCNRKVRKHNLEVHHIKRWADSYALRYEVSNGITLCKGCHFSIRNKEEYYFSVFHRIVHGKENQEK